MARKPVIGITMAHCTEELQTFPREFYIRCIKRSGGNPLLVPPVASLEEGETVLAVLDGLLLSGGGDISPYLLGERPQPGIRNCVPERDRGELFLAEKAMAMGMPLLGICKGIQVMAAAVGGMIAQDLDNSGRLEHSQKAPRHCPWHEVELRPSRLAQIVGCGSLAVNSFHHQAVSQLPDGFVLSALAPDGVIEGMEKASAGFCIGVQWHPESMEEEEHSLRLFAEFIKSAQ